MNPPGGALFYFSQKKVTMCLSQFIAVSLAQIAPVCQQQDVVLQTGQIFHLFGVEFVHFRHPRVELVKSFILIEPHDGLVEIVDQSAKLLSLLLDGLQIQGFALLIGT